MFRFCAVPIGILLVLTFVQAPAFGQETKRDKKAPQIWQVEIRGNFTFNDFVVNDIMATKMPSMLRQLSIRWKRNNPLDESVLKDDAVRIERFYQRRGFPGVKVSYTVLQGGKRWQRGVRFLVNEGSKLYISQTTIQVEADSTIGSFVENNRALQRVLKRHPFQEGRRFESVKIGEYRELMENSLKDAGFAFAQVAVSSEVKPSGAEVRIELKPGALTYLDTISISGYKTVPENLVRREMNLKQGQLYSRRELLAAQRDLYAHHLFRYATVTINDQIPAEKVPVRITVSERPLRAIELRGGVGNEDLLRAQVNWTHRNLFGNAHSFSASIKGSFIEQRSQLNYLIPFLFNNKSSLNISPFGYHLIDQSYNLYSYGLNNALVYQANPKLTTSVAYEFTVNNETPTTATLSTTPVETRSFNLSTLTFAAFYDAGYLTQGEGWIFQPTYQISGLTPGSDQQFQKLSFDVRNYMHVGQAGELAMRISPGVIFAMGQDSLPSSVRFFLGGSNSVRGFSRQFLGPKIAALDDAGRFAGYVPLGGSKKIGFNLEFRQRTEMMGSRPGFAVFLDGGQVWLPEEKATFNSLQYALGAGIRWQSFLGPVRFDVGYKVNPTEEDLNIYLNRDYGFFFTRFGFHISVGQAF